MLLTLPAAFSVGLLLYHSLLYRPLRATLLLVAFMVPVAACTGGDAYVFTVPGATLSWHGVTLPIFNIVGFLFALQCALILAIHILDPKDGRREVPLFRLLALIVLIVALIGIAIEHVNETTGWWTWRHDDSSRPPPSMTLFYFVVWAWRPALIFPVVLQYFVRRPRRQRAKTRILSVAYLVAFSSCLAFEPALSLLGYFVVLPLLAWKVKQPAVSLEHLQWEAPMPVTNRWLRRADWTFIGAHGRH